MRIYFLFEGREVFSNVVAIHFSSTHFLLTQSHNMKSYLRSYTMCSIHIYEFILYIIGDHTMPRTRSTMETNSSLINMYNTWSIMKWIREKKGYWWTEINYALWHFWLVHQVNSNLYHDSRNRYNIARLLSARVTIDSINLKFLLKTYQYRWVWVGSLSNYIAHDYMYRSWYIERKYLMISFVLYKNYTLVSILARSAFIFTEKNQFSTRPFWWRLRTSKNSRSPHRYLWSLLNKKTSSITYWNTQFDSICLLFPILFPKMRIYFLLKTKMSSQTLSQLISA